MKGLFFVTYDFADREPELIRRIIHDYVKENFGYEMRYFRFPSGNFNEQTLAVVQSMGYKSVFWSFAYKDWLTDDQPDPKESEERIVKAACPGNIYLLHAVSSTNARVQLGGPRHPLRAHFFPQVPLPPLPNRQPIWYNSTEDLEDYPKEREGYTMDLPKLPIANTIRDQVYQLLKNEICQGVY